MSCVVITNDTFCFLVFGVHLTHFLKKLLDKEYQPGQNGKKVFSPAQCEKRNFILIMLVERKRQAV